MLILFDTRETRVGKVLLQRVPISVKMSVEESAARINVLL